MMQGRALLAHDILPAFQSLISKLAQSFTIRQNGSTLHNVKVGVCVSGGPDSMALAYLISTMPVIDGIRVVPVGLIVDHHVRSGSTEEAQQVRVELERIGISSKILKMAWPQDSHPSRWPNFESEARKRRYRLIALEAIHSQIRHIFTGHHMDDQIETGIMRLALQNHDNLLGLSGISSVAPVPCCDDIYGAHEEHEHVERQGHRSRGKAKLSFPSNLRTLSLYSSSLFEHGGLTLHRPLLGFAKVDLTATCVSNNVAFVNDKTNADPTFTKRNAVRSLRNTHRLPEALQANRILELQDRAEQWIKHVQSSGSQILQSCLLHKLDLTSGVLKVELPPMQDTRAYPIPGLSNALSRLIDIITPFPRSEMPLQVPDQLVRSLFPAPTNLAPDHALGSDVKFRHTIFTPSGPNTWTLSRQPMRPEEIKENTWQFSTSEIRSFAKYYQTSWKLWDNRFWIRVSCPGPAVLEDLTICPLTVENLSKLNADLLRLGTDPARTQMAKLKKILKAAAPEKTRYTLPVVARGGKILVLPTLNFYIAGPGSDAIRAEVRYKTLRDIEHLRLVRKDKNEKGVTSLGLSEIPGLRPGYG